MAYKHRVFQLVIIVFLAISMSGCFVLKEKLPAPTMNVIELIIRGDYTQAHVQAQQQAKQDPEQLKQVNTVIANYEAALPEKLQDHILHQRWEEIHLLLVQAEQRIPDSPVLSEAKVSWLAVQEEELKRLKVQNLIVNSEALYANRALDEQLLRITPLNSVIKQRFKGYSAKAKKMSAKLVQIGKQALEEEHFFLAEQTLPLAYQLNVTQESKAAKIALDNLHAQQQQDALALKWESLAQQKKQQFERLMNELKDALAKEQLVRSVRLLKQAEVIDSDHDKLREPKLQLQQKVAQAVELNLAQGIKHYRQEQFAEAIEDWTRVLQLEPDNKQAQINILRAEKVMSNLQRLIDKRG